MAFSDLQNFSTPPGRITKAPIGSILYAFPPVPIDPHSRLGYTFRMEPCTPVTGYPPDACVQGQLKMEPDVFHGEKSAELRVMQSAFKCSTLGATDEELREIARSAINRNLWRDIDQTLVEILSTDCSTALAPAPLGAGCILTEAAQFLATNSFAGTGVIYGSLNWMGQLWGQLLFRDGNIFHDMFGNLVIPSSIDSNTVYVFDSKVEVRTSDIQLLDEHYPGMTIVNDRTVRAELTYTVAVDNCACGHFTLGSC